MLSAQFLQCAFRYHPFLTYLLGSRYAPCGKQVINILDGAASLPRHVRRTNFIGLHSFLSLVVVVVYIA